MPDKEGDKILSGFHTTTPSPASFKHLLRRIKSKASDLLLADCRLHSYQITCPVCGRSRRVQRTDFINLAKHPMVHMILKGSGTSAITSFLRTLPDFLIIGATKSGTTSLYGLMCTHPNVLPARVKEIGYFASTTTYMYGMQWYRAHFPTVLHKRYHAWKTGRKMLTGEATPPYMFLPDVPGRVRATIPNVRLLAILRNPVDRAYSEYNMRLKKGRESLTFEDAIVAEGSRASYEREKAASDTRSDGHDLYNSYLGTGRYAEQLIRWYECFDRNRLLILTTGELEDDRQGTLDRVFGFLGLEPFEVGVGALPDLPWMGRYKPAPGDPFRLNAGSYPPMRRDTRRMLVDYFRPHNERLYELLGRDLGWDR